MTASVALLVTLLTSPPASGPQSVAKAEWLGSIPKAPARRVVSLAPSWTEVLYALGAGDLVVGVTRYDDFPPEVLNKPKVGGFVDADVEAVLAQRPDVVVASPIAGVRGRYETLARLGVSVLLLPSERLDDLWFGAHTLGALTGHAERAEALTRSLKNELATLEAATQNAPRLRALLLVGYKPLIAAGPNSFYDALLPLLAADNVIRHGQPFTHLDLEAIAAAKPDVIIALTMGEEPPKDLWTNLRAVMPKPPHIARIHDPATLRLGPRLPQGMRALAEALRP